MKILKRAEKFIKKIIEKPILQMAKRKILPLKSDVIKEYSVRNVLFIRDDRCGDVIVSEPVFRYLKKAHPEVKIFILLGKHNISTLSGINPYIDKAFLEKKSLREYFRLRRELRCEKIDLIVDMKDSKSLISTVIMLLVYPRYTAGLDDGKRMVFNFPVMKPNPKKFNIYQRTGNILSLFGYDCSSLDLRPNFALNKPHGKYKFEQYKSAGLKICSINISGSNRNKYWGVDNYVSFVKLLNGAFPEMKILLLYTADYDTEASAIESQTPALKSELFPNFNDFAFCISASDILLTPDTSAIHLASAFGIKSIVLYAQDISDKTKEMPWFPYETEYRAFGSRNGQLSSISPKEVFEKSKTLFSSVCDTARL